MAKRYRNWSDDEDTVIVLSIALGRSTTETATDLSVTKDACRGRARWLGHKFSASSEVQRARHLAGVAAIWGSPQRYAAHVQAVQAGRKQRRRLPKPPVPRCQKRLRAYVAVSTAVRNGTLVRPCICETCGSTPGSGRDGRPLIQGHHHLGYDLPLEVQWLCIPCHIAADRMRSGEKNGAAVLTQEKVSEIRRRWATGKETKRGLAREFMVRDRTIRLVVENRTWVS